MNLLQVSQLFLKSTLTFVFILGIIISSSGELRAKSETTIEETAERLEIHFIPAGREEIPEGPPETSDAAGTRGNCLDTEIIVTRLVGQNDPLDLTLTTSQYPTFWFYVSDTPEQVNSGKFSLQDNQGRKYLRANFQLPKVSGKTTSGILSITLPQSAKPLEVGRTYQWIVEIPCSQTEMSSNPESTPETPASTYGLVERLTLSEVDTNLNNQLNTASNSLEKVDIYAQNGLWFDALTELAKLRLEYPHIEALNKHWRSLLTEVGLNGLIDRPIVGSVNITETKIFSQ
jgi:hypothetical protein